MMKIKSKGIYTLHTPYCPPKSRGEDGKRGEGQITLQGGQDREAQGGGSTITMVQEKYEHEKM
jgi:hypothetical protein